MRVSKETNMKNISRRLMVLGLCIYGSAAHADNESIALFTKNQTNPSFESVRLGAQSAAKEMHVTLSNYVPTHADSIPEQMSEIDDVIVKHPDAVVFIPVDFKAMGAGIAK